MTIPTFLLWLFGAAAGGTTLSATIGHQDMVNEIPSRAKYDLESTIAKNFPSLSSLTVDDLLDQLYDRGYIDDSTKTHYLNLMKELGDGDYTNFDIVKKKTGKEVAKLYELIQLHLPEINEALNTSPDYIKDVLSSGLPQLTGAPAPSYLDTSFKSPFDLDGKQADPLKWWKGEELAEHHNLHWDLDEMYEKVKQGTEAAVERDKYNSAHQNWESLMDNHEDEVAYLANLRSTKSDAITSGATAGARAANELLGMLNSTSQFSQNQLDVANNRFETVNQALLDDANARVTANNAYMNLGKDIFKNIEYLYANDVDRRGGELEAYANMFAADQALRAERIKANADMEREQRLANAAIAGYQADMNNQVNQYKWVWERLYGAAKEKGYTEQQATVRANTDFFNWVRAEGLSQAGTTYDNFMHYRDRRNLNDQ